MRTLRHHRFALAGAASVLAVVVLGIGWMWLRESPLVRVSDVTITGAQGSQAEEIRSALRDAAQDMTTLHVRPEALKAAVQQYPSVASLEVAADVPHRLRITVQSRTPVAALDTGTRRLAVAGDGTVLTGAQPDGLPRVKVRTPPGGTHVRGATTVAIVRMLASAPAALRARSDRAYVGPDGLTVVLRDGPQLRFGRGERLAAKWTAAARVLADEQARGATYLDLRLPERPAAGGLAPTVTETDDPGAQADPGAAAVAPTVAASPTAPPTP